MPYLATVNFTGMRTEISNQTIIMGMRPCVDLLTEIVGNDEFDNRSGTDDSTKNHMIQLIENCDRTRRLITRNPNELDIKSVVDYDIPLEASLSPIAMDNVQMASRPKLQLPWRFDGSDPNIPTWDTLRFRNGLGGVLYGHTSNILVQYTRLESARKTWMITVADSLRMHSLMQSFRDICDKLLGHDNQVDIAQPLATDEPSNSPLPNRITETAVEYGSSLQNKSN